MSSAMSTYERMFCAGPKGARCKEEKAMSMMEKIMGMMMSRMNKEEKEAMMATMLVDQGSVGMSEEEKKGFEDELVEKIKD